MTNKELIQEYLKNNDITKLPTGIATSAVMHPLTRKQLQKKIRIEKEVRDHQPEK